MTGFLYRWPQNAKFGRVVPKNKFYEHGRVTTALREKFVDEIQRITWAYKLAESTINLAGSVEVPEIQVFHIDAKSEGVSEAVLTAIDRAVKTPIIFEVTADNAGATRTRMVAAHKQPGPSNPAMSDYFMTSWQPADGERIPLPTAIDLPGLYRAILQPLLPVCTRPGEDIPEATRRVEAACKLKREISALERKIRNEPQFNRKVELRRTLKEKQATLAQLTGVAEQATATRN
jgi:Domain of unknown function (DUF4391)